MAKWIKLHTDILTDPKMGRMSDKLFRRTIELFLIAGREDDDGVLPSVQDIAWHLRTSEKETLSILEDLTKVGIVERGSDGSYLISHFVERQNSDLTRSEINRRYYEKTKQAKSEIQTDEGLNVRSDSDIAASEIQTLERDIDIEEDKIKNINTLSIPAKKPAPQKHQHGSFKNVLLTDAEFQKLHERFLDADERIEHFSKKKAAKGYVYKSDYAAILSWAQDKAEQPRASVTIPTAPRKPTNAELMASLELEGLDE